jgi:hypothetical protein
VHHRLPNLALLARALLAPHVNDIFTLILKGRKLEIKSKPDGCEMSSIVVGNI